MSWWNNLFGDNEAGQIDYYVEGMDLLVEGKYHEALTSFRLALKEDPGDAVILQQIAIAYTRIGMADEAAKTYRHVLQKDPSAPGAHYGLAFLLLRAGQEALALEHLKSFLENAPTDASAAEHVQHARTTLAELSTRAQEAGDDR